MEFKLVYRIPQASDLQEQAQTAIENELRARLVLLGTGIVSTTGTDVDTITSPCAVVVNSVNLKAIDVLPGRVVFPIGEETTLTQSSIVGQLVDSTISDPQVIRLEYGEVPDLTPISNPYYNFQVAPIIREKTPLEMLVIETVTQYTAQSAEVKNRSVVLGVAAYVDGVLSLDLGRDTYTFSRPWFSPADVYHRSRIGSGISTDTNPHGTSPADLTVGSYSMVQALVGQPNCVLARPVSVGRVPGSLCTQTIPAGDFLLDSTGQITGKAGAKYAPLGTWPYQLLKAVLSSDGVTEVAAWIPHGRQVIAVWDPINFATASNLFLRYTKVTAGALPDGLVSSTAFEVADPTTNELIMAGGNLFSSLTSKAVSFIDTGIVPMEFDIKVDKAGKVYKSPECLYCNTKLDSLGASPVNFPVQPRTASRLRIAISGYNPGFTQIQLQITGTDESGSPLTEVITFNGPLPPANVSYQEAPFQWQFSQNIFATGNQVQVIVRNNDGPNTTVTIFSEGSPTRALSGDDLLLATVQWTGVEVTGVYANTPFGALDQRLVTRGGGVKGYLGAGNQPGLVETVLGGLLPGVTTVATFVEDFSQPTYMTYPTTDASVGPVELDNSGTGIRHGYQSRVLPFADSIPSAGISAFYMRMLPSAQINFPAYTAGFTCTMTVYSDSGTSVLTGVLSTKYAPFEIQFTGTLPAGNIYATQISIPRGAAKRDLFSGYLLHVRG